MMDLIDELIMEGRLDESAACTYKVKDRDNMIGLVLVIGGTNITERDLETLLAQYPLKYALANGYEVQGLKWWRRFVQVLEHYGDCCVSIEATKTSKTLIEDASHRVNIAARACGVPQTLFRAHVPNAADR